VEVDPKFLEELAGSVLRCRASGLNRQDGFSLWKPLPHLLNERKKFLSKDEIIISS
jgi:hypothetical protein